MVLLEFSMFPLDRGVSLSPYVARCVEIIDRSGLDYQFHAMGTTLEGDFNQVIRVVQKCFEALASDCERVECNIKIDYRKGPEGRLRAKVASVEAKLGREVRK
jgi:uncharacterized protein (TIGR00106 family)